MTTSNKILAVLSASLLPMCNAFFIMLIVAMICAHRAPKTLPRPQRSELRTGKPTRWTGEPVRWPPGGHRDKPWRTGKPSQCATLTSCLLCGSGCAEETPLVRAPPASSGESAESSCRLSCRSLTVPRRADSVMGVSLFRDQAPEDFGVFTLALCSMFRLTAGETQVRVAPPAAIRRARTLKVVFSTAQRVTARIPDCFESKGVPTTSPGLALTAGPLAVPSSRAGLLPPAGSECKYRRIICDCCFFSTQGFLHTGFSSIPCPEYGRHPPRLGV